MKGDSNALRQAHPAPDASGDDRPEDDDEPHDLLEQVRSGEHADRCAYIHPYFEEDQ